MRAFVVLVFAAGCGRIDFDAETHAVDGSTDAIGAGDASSCAAPAGDWVLQQVQGNSDDMGQSTFTVMVNATGGGDFMVVAVQGQAPGVATNVYDGAGSPYVRLDRAAGADTAAGNTVEIWYSPGLGGGANDVSVVFSTVAYAMVVWEFATPYPAVVDTVAQLSNQAATTTPVAPTLTTRCPGEVVVAAVISQNVSGIASGNEFTNDETSNSEGWAHLADVHAPAGMHTAEWTSTGGSYCSSAAAFIVE